MSRMLGAALKKCRNFLRKFVPSFGSRSIANNAARTKQDEFEYDSGDNYKVNYNYSKSQPRTSAKSMYATRDPAASYEPAEQQLSKYRDGNQTTGTMTMSNGAPVANKTAVLTAGPRGPMLLQDHVFIDEMAHFDRERIPERVVHAKGIGAHGVLKITGDITKYSKAAVFKPNTETECFVRFSTVGGESGSADTARDPRGFAMKFYTTEGNWDLVGNNTPIFFIRDPILFPSFIHTQKRNPQTHLKDANMMWDFWSLRPESVHQVLFLFSDRGTPDGVRHMHGYGSHTFKLVNKDKDFVYCKFHFKTNQKIKNLTASEAAKLTATDPDYATRDLFNAIEKQDYPSWTFYIQVMTNEEAGKFPFNPFDVTKIWPHADFPLIEVGQLVLNENPKNYFAEVEQSAFSPAHVVPGIEFSPDKMLQGRIFSYTDTHFHRLGPNYLQLPVNCPYTTKVQNVQRDGAATFENQGNAPNYHPNSFNGPVETEAAEELKFAVSGEVKRYDTKDDHNYEQPREFWIKVLREKERDTLVENIFNSLKDCHEFIRERAVNNFTQVHPDFGKKLHKLIAAYDHKKYCAAKKKHSPK